MQDQADRKQGGGNDAAYPDNPAQVREIGLTVFFDDPFWTGVLESTGNGNLSACRAVFGTEPKDYEVWDFILGRFAGLEFSPAVEKETRKTADNPKRRQRNAKKLLESRGTGTKSQQALQKQREEHKLERHTVSREQREAEKQRQFDIKQQKRKEKHRGH